MFAPLLGHGPHQIAVPLRTIGRSGNLDLDDPEGEEPMAEHAVAEPLEAVEAALGAMLPAVVEMLGSGHGARLAAMSADGLAHDRTRATRHRLATRRRLAGESAARHGGTEDCRGQNLGGGSQAHSRYCAPDGGNPRTFGAASGSCGQAQNDVLRLPGCASFVRRETAALEDLRCIGALSGSTSAIEFLEPRAARDLRQMAQERRPDAPALVRILHGESDLGAPGLRRRCSALLPTSSGRPARPRRLPPGRHGARSRPPNRTPSPSR